MFYKIFLLSLLSCATVIAQDNAYEISPELLQAIPTIPKSQERGIDVYHQKKIHKEENKEFKKFELSTKGNHNAALVSGVSVFSNHSSTSSQQQTRPRIGLVLSGGGARGGAHLGIIQAFEYHNIPIDAIVGTSMGSFIGGLYASGMSSSEIERELTTMDWTEVITFDYDRKEIPFRRKRLQRAFPGNAKMGINKDNDVVLGTGLFKRQMMLGYLKKKTYGVSHLKNFDELRIPFRSVASRLEDGHTRVLRDGSLAEAIYASLAIPGGFDPITINGEVLVDGGVADNLPLDVMRQEMDVDYIVVVDISTPYDEHEKFDNYLAVMGQLVNILMRKNVEQTVDSMVGQDNEILIRPDLTGYGSLDADKYPEIIAIGRKKGEAVYQEDLSHLSLYELDYYNYIANRPKPKKYEPPVIDKIIVDNGTYLNDQAILDKIHAPLGVKLDPEQLDKDIADIYNMMIFDDVSFKVIEIDGENVLKITTTPSWDVNGQIKFAFGFSDNFNGHSDYFFKLEYIKFGLNSYGGEWRNRVSFGVENLILSELYQPIDVDGNFYVRPVGYFRNKKVYVSPTILDPDIQASLSDTFPLQAKDYGVGSGMGVNISNSVRIELFGSIKRVEPSADFVIKDVINNTLTYQTQSATADIYNFGVEFEVDTLDNAFFPRSGHRFDATYSYNNQFYMQDPDPVNPNEGKTTYSKYNLEYAGAFTFGRHTFSPRLQLAETVATENFQNSQDFGSYATLGGLFHLSGLPTNALTGNNVAFGEVVYRYRLTEDGFFGSLTPPTYVGMSLESGDAWYNKDLDPVNGRDSLSVGQLKYASSIYLAADTIIGPFYMGVGGTTFESEQYYSFYISLGQAF